MAQTIWSFPRQSNTTTRGKAFDTQTVEAVWQKARIIPGYDGRVVRQDLCGTLIRRDHYGLKSDFGWEVDHMVPVARGGTDVLHNLQPLQWINNRRKADDFPWICGTS